MTITLRCIKQMEMVAWDPINCHSVSIDPSLALSASKMKAFSFPTGLLCLAALTMAAPGHGGGHDPKEAAASRRIDHLQSEYQKYIRDTIKTRKTGCTSKNILRRREW